MTDTRAQEIAGKLTKAQAAAIMSATIRPPHATFMPDYHAVRVPGFCDNAAVEELGKIGVWSLPIRTGNYWHTVEWCGQMLPLGLAVRRILERQDHADQ